jgi:exodeoxyribonuclease-5
VKQVLPPIDEYEPVIEEVSSEPYQEPGYLQEIATPTQEQLLPGITLNQGQNQALNEMLDFLKGDRAFHTLSGFAGTGKTTVLQALITKLRKHGDRREVIFTAPTNKAVKVLAQMVDRWDLNVDAMTCHKLLGLKPHKNGKTIEFEPDPKEDPKFNRYELVVVDESSMLPESLYFHISNNCGLGQKILFVGDEYQAPPVNEARSLVFEKVLDVSRLSKIERYSGTNAVIVERVRQTIDIAGKLPNFETVDEGDRGVFVLDRKAWEHTLLKYFQSEEYANNPDYCRAIAYSNKRVEALNQKVRDRLVDSADQWTVGERIIAQEAYSPGDTVVLQTSDEGQILRVDHGSIEKWDCLFLTVRLDIGETVCVPVVQSAVKAQFESRLNELAEQKDWYRYWGLRETFADVRSPFAITGHKSQGSTYTNAFIDVANFNSTYAYICKGKPESFVMQKLRERNQLLYTAMGRASHKLFLCV